MALVEVPVVEQRYRAVLEVRSGVPVTDVAARFGMSRQSAHTWVRRYAEGGLSALADRSRHPESSSQQVSPEIEAAVCEARREHPKWGPVRIAHELGRIGVTPAPSRMTVYRVLVRHGLIEPGPRAAEGQLPALGARGADSRPQSFQVAADHGVLDVHRFLPPCAAPAWGYGILRSSRSSPFHRRTGRRRAFSISGRMGRSLIRTPVGGTGYLSASRGSP